MKKAYIPPQVETHRIATALPMLLAASALPDAVNDSNLELEILVGDEEFGGQFQ